VDGVTLGALDVALVAGTDAEFGVSASRDAPAATAPPDASVGDVLAYFDVTHPSLADDDVTGTTFRFTVPRDALADRDLEPADVTLYRSHGGEWTGLDTRLVDETADAFVFEAESPGLSAFAVVAGGSDSGDPGDGTGGEPTDPGDDSSDDETGGGTADSTDAGEDSGGSGSSGQPGFGPVLALIALVAGLAALSQRGGLDGER
jgi:PGF-CTERM protein